MKHTMNTMKHTMNHNYETYLLVKQCSNNETMFKGVKKISSK